MAYELVRPVNPAEFATAIEDFGESFGRWACGLDRADVRTEATFRVHREKASMRLWEELRRHQLVIDRDGEWLHLPRSVEY